MQASQSGGRRHVKEIYAFCGGDADCCAGATIGEAVTGTAADGPIAKSRLSQDPGVRRMRLAEFHPAPFQRSGRHFMSIIRRKHATDYIPWSKDGVLS
jgi:hypothetical protein